MNAIICDFCKKQIEPDNSKRIVIYEKLGYRRNASGEYVGHSKLDVCVDCLIKLGYVKRIKEDKEKNVF